MRYLDNEFLSDLKNGKLKTLLQAVQLDDTLCLEIRENYINVYYRGGNLLLVEKKGTKYCYTFDYNYCIHEAYPSKYEGKLRQNEMINDWVDSIPLIKAEMDLWFYENPKLEREYQQVILRDNNNSKISTGTDYFISDIEYANSEHKCRFDLLGVKWLSDSSARKKSTLPTLAVMELKYGDDALTGKAGLQKHFSDINKFFSNPETRDAIYKDAETMFNQKIKLGLIQGTKKEIQINKNEKPEFILIFANHDPASEILLRELEIAYSQNPDIKNYVTIKIATSSYMGYGLYDGGNMIGIKEFIDSQGK